MRRRGNSGRINTPRHSTAKRCFIYFFDVKKAKIKPIQQSLHETDNSEKYFLADDFGVNRKVSGIRTYGIARALFMTGKILSAELCDQLHFGFHRIYRLLIDDVHGHGSQEA